MSEQNIQSDVENNDTLTELVKGWLNSFPLLDKDDSITFATLQDNNSKTFYTDSGALILRERESIVGYVKQDCIYPFVVIYRSGGSKEKRKIAIKDWLDLLGNYMSGQPIEIEGTTYQLEKPVLDAPLTFKKIERTTNTYMLEPNNDNMEDWVTGLQVNYTNEFWR